MDLIIYEYSSSFVLIDLLKAIAASRHIFLALFGMIMSLSLPTCHQKFTTRLEDFECIRRFKVEELVAVTETVTA